LRSEKHELKCLVNNNEKMVAKQRVSEKDWEIICKPIARAYYIFMSRLRDTGMQAP